MRTASILVPCCIIACALAVVLFGSSVNATASNQDALEATPVDDAAKKAEEQKQRERNITTKERALALSEMRIEKTRLEIESSRIDAENAVAQAETELVLARGRLEEYVNFESKQKVEQAKLSLQSSRDRATEAAEELKQIELMYADQDLDDKTAEFVIQRGRRNAERAQARIALEEMALTALMEHEVPRERSQRELEIRRKENALESARRAKQSRQLQSAIDLRGWSGLGPVWCTVRHRWPAARRRSSSRCDATPTPSMPDSIARRPRAIA